MSVCVNKDKNEIIVTCECGCDHGVRMRLDPCWDEPDCTEFAWMSFLSNDVEYDKRNWVEKIKRIWAIIRNKDYCYNEVIMTKDEVKDLASYCTQMVSKYEK